MTHLKSTALAAAASVLVLAACASPATDTIKPAADAGFQITGSSGTALQAEELETFDSPWAMAFLPDGRALVTLQT